MLSMYAIIALSGILIGGLSTAKILKNKEPVSEPVAPIIIEPVDPLGDVTKQLTDLDLLIEPCSSEYIKEQGNLLCREMYCRVMTRGIDSKTSGQECEAISNVANSQMIVNHCESFLEGSKECYEKYRERK